MTTVAINQAEALERRDALAREIRALVVSKRELTDIVLDALLSAYVNVADETGRLKEVPPVLRKIAEAVALDQLVPTHH